MGEFAPKKNKLSFNASILIKKEDGMFVAHCLELDIVAVGETIEEAQKSCAELICAQLEYAFVHDNLDNLFHPAPKSVWDEFYQCQAASETTYKVTKKLKEEAQKTNTTLLPPWLTAKTCFSGTLCHV